MTLSGPGLDGLIQLAPGQVQVTAELGFLAPLRPATPETLITL